MLQGWLAVNGYITNPKFLEIYQWLQEAGRRQGIEIRRKTNIQLMEEFCKERGVAGNSSAADKDEKRSDFVLFWDKDVRLAALLEAAGLRLFNSAESIAACDDKAMTYIRLKKAGIRMPDTWIAPKTFAKEGYYDELDFFEHAGRHLTYPLVVKECFGSFGAQVYLAHSYEEVKELLGRLKNRPFLLQKYVASSKGRDIRIQMVGGEAVACMYRYNDHDFRANITNGGKMKAYTPNALQIRMAREACSALGLDFAGVDILFGEGEEPILCEVNSNAHFKNIYDCTGVNVADKILAYIKKELEMEECADGMHLLQGQERVR